MRTACGSDGQVTGEANGDEKQMLLLIQIITNGPLRNGFCVSGIEQSSIITTRNPQNNPTRQVVLLLVPTEDTMETEAQRGNNLPKFTHMKLVLWDGRAESCLKVIGHT